MLGVPRAVHTGYLLWIWPRPAGMTVAAQLGPYAASLLAGLPFAAIVASKRKRPWTMIVYLTVGFIVLWLYSVAMLCAVRNVCL